ncbi:response regulator transcription factor, partial [Enterocloster lavalensis]|uniref:response regulator transcription factor n=1 Tax=Enterocloster lavalensis TaxID=460384 RepID=UPI002A7F394D
MKNRILVVEDERIISDLICMNLEAAGYETRAVYDGSEAAGLLREQGQEAADLALVDIMLPGMDGFALMELFQGKHIPVIYLTAKADVTSKVRGLKLGAEDYIVKPFEVLELLVRMEKVLERTGKMKPELCYGDLVVDLNMHRVWEGGAEVDLKSPPNRAMQLARAANRITT